MQRITLFLLLLSVLAVLAGLFAPLSADVSIAVNAVAAFSAVAAFLTIKQGKKEEKTDIQKEIEEDFKDKIERWKGVIKLDEKMILSEMKDYETKAKNVSLSMPIFVESKSEYEKFLADQKEAEKAASIYEKYLEWCGGKLKLKVHPSLEKYFQEQIKIGSIKSNPERMFASLLLTPLLLLLPLLPVIIFLPMFYKVLSVGVVIAVAYIAYLMPMWIATQVKMNVQTDMLYAMLYMSLFLRLNPSLEGAVLFASERIFGPLGADLKKAIWDLHMRKYPDIMQSVGQFQEKWAVWNDDFSKSLSVLNASLREVSENRRANELERALELLLEGTHTKMGRFAEILSVNVKLFRGLLLLPILLSLVLPMVSVFMSINPGYLITLFDILLPVVNFTIGMKILADRPGTFKIDVYQHPAMPKRGVFRLGNFFVPLLPVAVLLFLLIGVPGFIHLYELGPLFVGGKVDDKILQGEYEWVSMVKSWLITFSISFAIFVYWYGSNIQKMPLRNEIKSIEQHFQSTIRELGIALRENIPLENALRMILDEYRRFNLQNSPMYRFLENTVNTMNSAGVTFRTALFDPTLGVMKTVPSALVKNVLSILAESTSKGPEQAAVVCESIGQYLRKIDELNKDFHKLVVEEITSMQMESTMLTPLLCAGVSAMTVVLVKSISMIGTTLATLEKTLMSAFNIYQSGSVAESLLRLVDPSKIIPPTILQVIIGIFLVEVTVIYSMLRDGIENGPDEVTNGVTIGKGAIISVIVYTLIMFAIIFFLGSMVSMATFAL